MLVRTSLYLRSMHVNEKVEFGACARYILVSRKHNKIRFRSIEIRTIARQNSNFKTFGSDSAFRAARLSTVNGDRALSLSCMSRPY